MLRILAPAFLMLCFTFSTGEAFAQYKGPPAPAGHFDPTRQQEIQDEAWAYEYYLGCDYLRQLHKYGDDIDARRACQGLMFN